MAINNLAETTKKGGKQSVKLLLPFKEGIVRMK